MPRLENWSLQSEWSDELVTPTRLACWLRGQVFDDERFRDGDLVRTSQVKSIDTERRTAVTRNTTYELGDIDPEYVWWCINNGHDLRALREKSDA